MPDLMPAPEELDVLSNRGNLVLGLYQNNVAITPQTTMENLVECDFPGYERADPAGFDNPRQDEDEVIAEMEAPPLTFQRSETGPAQNIQGAFVFLRTTAGNYFIQAVPFPSPVPMVNKGDKFTFRPRIQLTDFEFPEL